MSKKPGDSTCPRCEGSGQCAECQGTGQVTCLTCNGKGQSKTPRGLAYACKTCNGSGQMACSPLCASCEGTGVITAALQRKIQEKYVPRYANTSPLSKVTNLLLLANIIVFVAQQAPGVEQALWNPPDSLQNWELWRFVTPMFMHGGWMHLGMNCWFLLRYCPQLEGLYGSGRFLALYLFSGLVGDIVSWLFNPMAGIGASGALFGVAAAYLALHYRWGYFGREEMSPWGLYLVGYMVLGFMAQLGVSSFGFLSNIDNWGHLGGFVGGFLFAWVTRRPMGR